MTTRCCVVTESRYQRNGAVYWDPRNNITEAYWRELLDVFDEVSVFARAHATAEPPRAGMTLPEGVQFIEAPYYVGIAAMLRRLPSLLAATRRLTSLQAVFLLRGPGFLSMIVAAALWPRRKPYFVQVLGDSGAAIKFSSGRFRGPMALVARFLARATCRGAASVTYVAPFLQTLYPARRGATTAVVSDVSLDDSTFRPAHTTEPGTPLRLVLVANMEQPYKGHVHLLEAVAMLRRDGVPVRLRLAGDGRQRLELEDLSRRLGLAGEVEFLGPVAWGEQLFSVLDDSDLFVLPSLTEGMPKAVLEAMARGLPVIATPVGALPDVLPADALFAPADAAAIASKIMELHADRAALARLAAHGRSVAERFRAEALAAKRRELYAKLTRLAGAATYLQ